MSAAMSAGVAGWRTASGAASTMRPKSDELAGDHGDEAGHADEKCDDASSCHGSSSGFGNVLRRL